MPISWLQEADKRRLVITYTDPYTLDEWFPIAEAIISSGLLADHAVLIDRRHSAPPSPDFVQALIEFFEAHAPRMKGTSGAIIVKNARDSGMSRMLAAWAEIRAPNYTVRVFDDYAKAEAWLDRPVRRR